MRALFIIYRSLLLGCISNLREIVQLRLDLLHFKDIMIQINVLSQESFECSFNYCIPISIFKVIGQLLIMLWGFCFLKTGGPCHVDAIAVVLALEDYQNSIAKNFFSPGRGGNLKQYKLINEDLVSGRSRI